MENSAEEAIEKLLKKKSLKFVRGDSDTFVNNRIPFDIPVLDKLTGGGIPFKKMTLIYGPTNVGKSYLASQIVANAQKMGGKAVWVDTELSYDKDWMGRCGVDNTKILVSQPTTGEEALDHVREAMLEGFEVIVLDSIAGLIPSAISEEVAKGDFAHSPMAWQARFVNSSFPKLFPYLQHGSAFVAINQVRASMGPVALDNMPAGQGQVYFAHSILQVQRKGWIEEKDKKVGFNMNIRLRKTKTGGENWDSAIVPFRVEGGIDVIESYLRDGIDQKIITQAGAWYTYGDVKVMGMNGLKEKFIEDEKLFEKLKDELTS
jgi:recombination protein RecA